MDERELRDRILRLQTELDSARRELESLDRTTSITIEVHPLTADHAGRFAQDLGETPGVLQVHHASNEMDTAVFNLLIDQASFDLSSMLSGGARLSFVRKGTLGLELQAPGPAIS